MARRRQKRMWGPIWLAALAVGLNVGWDSAQADGPQTPGLKTDGPKVTLVAGGGQSKVGGVPATEFQLITPFGVAFDARGNMFICEMDGERVLKVDPRGVLTIVAGDGVPGDAGDGGPAAKARFRKMHSVAVSPAGDIYLADTHNHRVRKIDGQTGVIVSVAGTGRKGFRGDGGPALEADFTGVYHASLDPAGKNLYVADLENRRVRKIDLTRGVVDTVAGNGKAGRPADGALARESPLVDPRAVIADDAGHVYILERGGHALRAVDPQGRIRTLAGAGSKGRGGDGGPALAATFNGPKHLCFDLQGDVLIADTENHVVRRVALAAGTVEHLAGTGRRGAGGLNGPPLAVELAQPHGVFVHPGGAWYIVDSYNHRVLKVE